MRAKDKMKNSPARGAQLPAIEWEPDAAVRGIEVRELFGAFGRLLFQRVQHAQDAAFGWADTQPSEAA